MIDGEWLTSKRPCRTLVPLAWAERESSFGEGGLFRPWCDISLSYIALTDHSYHCESVSSVNHPFSMCIRIRIISAER